MVVRGGRKIGLCFLLLSKDGTIRVTPVPAMIILLSHLIRPHLS